MGLLKEISTTCQLAAATCCYSEFQSRWPGESRTPRTEESNDINPSWNQVTRTIKSPITATKKSRFSGWKYPIRLFTFSLTHAACQHFLLSILKNHNCLFAKCDNFIFATTMIRIRWWLSCLQYLDAAWKVAARRKPEISISSWSWLCWWSWSWSDCHRHVLEGCRQGGQHKSSR